jgi:ribonuclease HII
VKKTITIKKISTQKASEGQKPKSLIEHDFEYMKQSTLIGTDEVGRGCLAGPVLAAAVSFIGLQKNLGKSNWEWLNEVNDSKKLNPQKRQMLADKIKEHCIWSIAETDVQTIDEIGILQASLLAMFNAVSQVRHKHETHQKTHEVAKKNGSKRRPKAFLVLVDGNIKIAQIELLQQSLIKGDSKSWHIAAASIVAKQARDEIMKRLSLQDEYKNYKWSSNVGYGSRAHVEAINQFGQSDLHRKKFLRKILGENIKNHQQELIFAH